MYKAEPDDTKVKELSKSINVNPYLSKILIQRGIETFQESKNFFRPSLNQLHDPFLMRNMDVAVNRLTEAISDNENILIYGDYDVDGTTSVSLMYLFLKQFSENLEYWIPDRHTEGYGISEKGINYAIENEFTLIIALDCGIREVNRAHQAKEAGIDLIICDHHLPGDRLPEAHALLDPKQPNCTYPFKDLSGCGVGFKFLEGFCRQNSIEMEEKLYQYLDLVAVSIAGDIVPIVGENRVLTFYGLKKLNEEPSAGLKSLMELKKKKGTFSISDIVFFLAPRINAAGRLSHADESVKLLIGEGEETIKFADLLNVRNLERRKYDQCITVEALEMISELTDDRKSTVLYKPSWHKGVIGIVASRCLEHYYRPTIILTKSEGKATGSARSVKGFDVHEAIAQCSDLLDQFGGHRYAAGLTLPVENVERFIQRFEEVVSDSISPEQLIPAIEIDVEIPLSLLSFKTYKVMNQMAPFGPQNMTPVFGTNNVLIDELPRVIKEKHIKGFLHAKNDKNLLEFIGFGLADNMDKLEVGKPFSIAYHLEENNYRSNQTLILNLKDVRYDV